LLAWPTHKLLPFDTQPLRVASAQVLALIVVLAQPVASLAWLGGTHVTLEQTALHEAAIDLGDYRHHGAPAGLPGHHEHQPGDRDGETDTRLAPQVTAGPEFIPAAPHAASFQDLLQAALTVVPKAPMPDAPPRYATPAGVVPSQHSPPVPQRPPILLLPTLAFL
jgi:hypothetical protein